MKWCVCLGLLVCTSGLFATDRRLSDAQKIQVQLQANKNKLVQKQREKQSAERNLGALSRELRFTEMSLEKAKKDLERSIVQERMARANLSTIQRQFDASSRQFSHRVRSIYVTQHFGVIEFFFGTQELASMLDSSYYFDRLMSRDSQLIAQLKTRYAQINSQQRMLSTQTQRIGQLRNDIRSRESELTVKAARQREYIASLHTQIQQLERQNADLERSSNELTQAIRRNLGREGYFASGTMIRPVNSWVSSYFGYRMHPIFRRRIHHNGIDFAGATGTRIRAAESGYVIVAGQGGAYQGYGKITVLDHGKRRSDGKRISTVYAHQSRILVKEGQYVKQGEEIGLVGSTGYSTGPHLHFEVREDGIAVNPLKFLQ
ncbi:hypothetical protein EBZ35_01240 [bacterium]|nr:hypothetical protein [bacterium]